jgi:hypothetical protein
MSTTIELYEKLKPKLGETETRRRLEFIESTVTGTDAATQDVALLGERSGLDLSTFEQGMVQGLAKLKSDLIRWTFFFWVSFVVVMTGIIFTLLKTIK